MSSSSIVALNPQQPSAVFCTPPLDAAAASRATELLQLNHDKWHMYFNDQGFHNHIAHQVLALYAFNAPPDIMKHHYDQNSRYQWAMKPVDKSTLHNLEDPAKFKQFLFKRDHYHDFLALFEAEIQKLGVRETLAKYLFGKDERARDMMNRLYAGILHPLIHLGYGLEWEQPAIIAEALAMTATHDAWPSALYDPLVRLLEQYHHSTRTLAELTEEAAASATLRASTKYTDDLRVRDGALGRGSAQIVPLAAQWAVNEDNLDAKIAELANYSCAMVFGAQREGKPFRIDFTLMHCANAVPLAAAAVRHPDVPGHMKAELVQRLGQYCLVTFVAQGSPDVRFDLLRKFNPKKPMQSWAQLTERAFHVPDDGHTIKLFRALRFAEQRSNTAGDQDGYILRGDDWLKAANMLIEIAERTDETHYVRGAGFDEAW